MRDVIAVKALIRYPRAHLNLSTELVDVIMDLAEYWPHTTCSLRGPVLSSGYPVSTGLPPADFRHGDTFLLRTEPLGMSTQADVERKDYGIGTQIRRIFSSIRPLKGPSWVAPRGKHPCRKIIFEILSRETDQGRPIYAASPTPKPRHVRGTWFDVGVDSQVQEYPVSEPIRWTEAESHFYAGGRSIDSSQSLILIPDQNLEECEKKFEDQKMTAIRNFNDSWPSTGLDASPAHCFRPTRPAMGDPRVDEQEVVQYINSFSELNRQHTQIWRWDEDAYPEPIEAYQLAVRPVFNPNGAFIRSLEVGESITLWVRARGGSVINTVERVRIRVYWAI